jgi:hypothetical protein
LPGIRDGVKKFDKCGMFVMIEQFCIFAGIIGT